MARDTGRLDLRIAELQKNLKDANDKLTVASVTGAQKEIDRLTSAIEKIRAALDFVTKQFDNINRQNSAEADHLYKRLQDQLESRKDSLDVMKDSTALSVQQSQQMKQAIQNEIRLQNKIDDILYDIRLSEYERAKLLKESFVDNQKNTVEYRKQVKLLRDAEDAIESKKRAEDKLKKDAETARLKSVASQKQIQKQATAQLASYMSGLGPTLSNNIARMLMVLSPTVNNLVTNLFNKITKSPMFSTVLTAGIDLLMLGIKKALERQDIFKKIQRDIGMTDKSLESTRSTLEGISLYNQAWYLTTDKINTSYMELSSMVGSVYAQSEMLIDSQVKLQSVYGLTNDEANELVKTGIMMNKTQSKMQNDLGSIINQYSKATGVGFEMGKVMAEVGRQSAFIKSNFKNNNELLAVGVMKAQLMGTSLEKIQGIMEGMLNLESSITSEIEAGLLINKEMNLDMARYYSLQGDSLSVMKEIQKVIPSMEQFNKLDQIQKQGVAKALNMDVTQLSEIVQQGELMKKLGVDQLSTFEELTKNDQTRVELLAQQGDAAAKQLMKQTEEATASERLAKITDQLSTSMRKLSSVLIGVGVALVTMSALATAIPTGGASLAVAAGAAGLISGIGASYALNDGAISPSGGLIVSKPKGGIVAQLDKNDNVVATTNPIGGRGGNNSDMSRVENLLQTLIEKVNQPVQFNINGTIIRELETQQGMIRQYLAGMGNSYGTLNKTF